MPLTANWTPAAETLKSPLPGGPTWVFNPLSPHESKAIPATPYFFPAANPFPEAAPSSFVLKSEPQGLTPAARLGLKVLQSRWPALQGDAQRDRLPPGSPRSPGFLREPGDPHRCSPLASCKCQPGAQPLLRAPAQPAKGGDTAGGMCGTPTPNPVPFASGLSASLPLISGRPPLSPSLCWGSLPTTPPWPSRVTRGRPDEESRGPAPHKRSGTPEVSRPGALQTSAIKSRPSRAARARLTGTAASKRNVFV